MPGVAPASLKSRPSTRRSADPARARGLRRALAGGPCPAPAIVRVPEHVDAQHFLVLLTRHRDSLIAAERLHRRYRYDFRRFSSTLAAYGHIRRLATAAPASAHVATSMRQLVEGFAAFHPEWELDRGDSFVNRDRYHSTVRDHLADLVACGLLTWQAGVNDEGEERRTELLLLDAPQVDVEELALAKTRLTWWARRYPGLDTGSSVRVPNAPRAAKALPPGQRAKRARARCKAAKAAKAAGGPAGARGFSSSGAPPSGALPALQGKASNPPSALNVPSATPTRTPELGSRTHRGANGLGVEAGARASAREFPSVPQGAVETKWNCIAEEEVDQSSGDLGHAGGALSAAGGVRSGAELSAEAERRVAAVLADPEQMARLATEQRSVDELHAAIGRQASRRTLELAASPAERAWPPIRVREAWALARYGPDQIGPGSATAVRLSHDRHAQLLRAVRRYERYIGLALAVAPGSSAERGRLEHLHGLPAGGWAPSSTSPAAASTTARPGACRPSMSFPASCARSPPPTTPGAGTRWPAAPPTVTSPRRTGSGGRPTPRPGRPGCASTPTVGPSSSTGRTQAAGSPSKPTTPSSRPPATRIAA